MNEIDNCVGYSLKFSDTPLVSNKCYQQSSDSSYSLGLFDNNVTKDGRPIFMTLADEVHKFLDMFEPDINADRDIKESSEDERDSKLSGDVLKLKLAPRKY